ncbi:MAG: sodium:proton antiporter NhaD [Bacteroidales bacterium]|nr:sodium:proton antiporter NhaD [Bacteroidales bacterium]MBN2819719.1 sodium:proton antiporter NhaD [Bacteroidales bacterium]
MFLLMVFVFIIGYTAIALEHTIHIDKAPAALLTGVLIWGIYILNAVDIVGVFTESHNWLEFLSLNSEGNATGFISHHELLHHLSEISEIVFLLVGAMTIVEVVDHHQGFTLITKRIKTTNKRKLIWIIGFLTFFMSATLDILTTTIVMVTLMRKLVADKKDRWLFVGMVVVAANSGGAWSPIGDVTTIMLWVKGQITAGNIIKDVLGPSLVSVIVPIAVLSFSLKGDVQRPLDDDSLSGDHEISNFEKKLFLFCGVGALISVPVFKMLTHLPPFMGMLMGLGTLWILNEIIHHKKPLKLRRHLSVNNIISKIDMPTILFFIGILLAVGGLQSAGHLALLSGWLDNATNGNIYFINIAIGVLSSIVDNVPLVAAAMGMYPVADTVADIAAKKPFMVDGNLRKFLAYCAGTGGSLLIFRYKTIPE